MQDRADKLKEFMYERHLTQTELAKALGCKQQIISRGLRSGSIPLSIELGLIKAYGFYLETPKSKPIEEEQVMNYITNKYGFKKASIIKKILKL